MTVHVDGQNVSDISSQLYRHLERWITISPASGADFGREPQLGFIVRWSGGEENFTRKVGSVTELLEVLRPIVLAQEARVKKDIKLAATIAARERTFALRAARAAVKKLEAE